MNTAIAPESVDLSALPSLPLSDRRLLPEVPCIYFAIDSQGAIQYIGRSVNLRQRWLGHHRAKDLSQVEGARLIWLEVSDIDLLPDVEEALIKHFKPKLNGLRKLRVRREEDANPTVTPTFGLTWHLSDVMADREIDNQQLHELTGLHPGTISKLKNNLPDRVDVGTLNLLCTALKCQPGELLKHISDKSLAETNTPSSEKH